MRIRLQIVLVLLFTAPCFPSVAQTLAPVEPYVHPELKKHGERFVKKIYKVADNVYSAVGWNVAGIVMIEGVDGIILVDAGLNPATSREVMQEFRKITNKPILGCGVVINTSFNVRGEPPVCTPEDAFRCFMGTEMDMLVVGQCVLEKSKQNQSLITDYKEAFELD